RHFSIEGAEGGERLQLHIVVRRWQYRLMPTECNNSTLKIPAELPPLLQCRFPGEFVSQDKVDKHMAAHRPKEGEKTETTTCSMCAKSFKNLARHVCKKRGVTAGSSPPRRGPSHRIEKKRQELDKKAEAEAEAAQAEAEAETEAEKKRKI